MEGAAFLSRLSFCRWAGGRSCGGTSPRTSAGAAGGGALSLIPGLGLTASFFAGFPCEGGSFFAGLSLGGSFFAGPLSTGLRCACDGLFFLAGSAGLASFGLSPPKRRCNKCQEPGLLSSLMVSPG